MSLYPPQPWHLTADARVSIWRVPPSRLSLPPGVSPLLVAGHASVFTAWIDYTPPGQLAYHELLAAVSIKARRVSCSITEIWVDSEASMAGGRELWAIPKDLATLDFTTGDRTFTATAATADAWIATAAFKRRAGLPLKLPTSFEVVQERDGLLRTPVGAKISPRPASADWSFNPDGPLGYLDGRRPVASLELPKSELRFGA
ncbi:acetoacetate decarboxylase family protein [Amycolatopsis kentuckyensis]|uniref:acetoacetate decarboxylase family protein n=1 Tax=Amycolatopsis kentuckyensis TaxID=218823 RepID=UPI00356A2BB7